MRSVVEDLNSWSKSKKNSSAPAQNKSVPVRKLPPIRNKVDISDSLKKPVQRKGLPARDGGKPEPAEKPPTKAAKDVNKF